jgi:(p)ppGpp synthase/HD superfamily hydrolase
MNPLMQDEKVLKAAGLAVVAHHGQKRRHSEIPFVIHPIRVAHEIAKQDNVTPDVVAAAFLHDVVEDTTFTVEQIEAVFGPEIAMLVESLTNISHRDEHKEKSRADRKKLDREYLRHAPRWAKVIKLLDRLDNLREMTGDTEQFIHIYVEESRKLVDAIGAAHIPLADLIKRQCDSLERVTCSGV